MRYLIGELREQRGRVLFRHGEQQSAGGLGIEEHVHHRARDVRRALAEGLGKIAVAVHTLREDADLGKREDLRQKRHVRAFDHGGHVPAVRHFARVPHETEAGHVGDAVHIVLPGDLASGAVELRHLRDGFGVGLLRYHVGLIRRGDDAGAERFGENEHVARVRRAVQTNFIRVGKARHGKAVFRFGIADGVAAGDDDAGLRRLRIAAAQHLAHGLVRHLRRYGHDIQRELRLRAHGVNIADGVRRGDLAEHEGIVHDRREEVQRLHEHELVRDLINAGVVARVVADEKPLVIHRGQTLEKLCERARADLRAAPGAACELCHADLIFHSLLLVSPVFSPFRRRR